MSILIPANPVAYIKTPIRYTQTIFPGTFVGHLRSATKFVGHKMHSTTHKNIWGTPATDNDQTRPATGTVVCGAAVAA